VRARPALAWYTGDMAADPLPGQVRAAAEPLSGQMRAAAAGLLGLLDDVQRALAARPFADEQARRWLEYRPLPRPGACVAQLSLPARKAAHRLLATGLSEHAYAQAMVIIALEEVLDRQEAGSKGRHSGDYWVTVFGAPSGGSPWSWRFEGHHLSVTMTISGDTVSPAPVFLGANPALVGYAGHPVSRPLGPEEDLARAVLTELTAAEVDRALVSDQAPADIRAGTRPGAPDRIEPAGLPAGQLAAAPRAALSRLARLYLDRLPAQLASTEAGRIEAGELHFAWEGPLTPGARHYYRLQGDDLLIEYDTTGDGNHAHTVLRRPAGDFGADLLAAHYQQAHA
jgi:hypothetical protein